MLERRCGNAPDHLCDSVTVPASAHPPKTCAFPRERKAIPPFGNRSSRWQRRKVQIVAERGRTGHWLKSLLLGSLLGTDMDEESPAVFVVGRNDQRHRLVGSATLRQAEKAADRYRAELFACGESEFCRKYGLPEGLADDR
jgi:hypothetical protein